MSGFYDEIRCQRSKVITLTLKMCYQSPMSSDFWINAWDSSAMPDTLHSNQYFRTILQLGPRTTNKYNLPTLFIHNSNPSKFIIVLLSFWFIISIRIFLLKEKTTSSVIQILKVKTIIDLRSCPISSKYYWFESLRTFCWNQWLLMFLSHVKPNGPRHTLIIERSYIWVSKLKKKIIMAEKNLRHRNIFYNFGPMIDSFMMFSQSCEQVSWQIKHNFKLGYRQRQH